METLPGRGEQQDPARGPITARPRSGGAGRSRPGPLSRLLRGPAADPRWGRPALLALLVLTALLYAAGLSRNGWANDFYSAAVQAGTRSWKAFFFGSFDASSFITVDKTPASLWVMELSARVFGLNYWSVLLPRPPRASRRPRSSTPRSGAGPGPQPGSSRPRYWPPPRWPR